MRWRSWLKWLWIEAWTELNFCSVCICRNRSIARSRRRNGWCEFSARLSNQRSISWTLRNLRCGACDDIPSNQQTANQAARYSTSRAVPGESSNRCDYYKQRDELDGDYARQRVKRCGQLASRKKQAVIDDQQQDEATCERQRGGAIAHDPAVIGYRQPTECPQHYDMREDDRHKIHKCDTKLIKAQRLQRHHPEAKIDGEPGR